MGLISNGTTLLDAGALDGGVSTGNLTLIKTLTASSSDDLTFVDGTDSVVLDDTYVEYIFKFINIHPATDGALFQVNFRDGGSAYDATKTSSSFRTYHDEADSDTTLGIYAAGDVAQGTGVQRIAGAGIGADNDQCVSGTLHLFDPSDTTFVTHYMIDSSAAADSDYATRTLVAGYCNVTAAIDGVQFTVSADEIDSGTIKLYGVG